MSTVLIYGIIYASAVTFVLACVVRALRYARAPLHLRWELYPVPHESPERARYGGSYFEELDWWTKPAHFSLWGELRVMLPEILFLKGLWDVNRKLWWRSFPFHFGLYLLIATVGLLLAPVLRPVYLVTGLAGAALTLIGAAALLHRRLLDDELKTYTTPGDIANLLFFILVMGLLIAGGPGTLDIVRGLVTFDTSLEIPPIRAAGLVAAALLAAYIPLTHMSHFIAKYFTYHAVRWDDMPVARRRELEKKVAAHLGLRPTWSASHLGADGEKTWAEIASANPWAGAKR